MRRLLSILLLMYPFNSTGMHIKNGSTKIKCCNKNKSIGKWIKTCLINPTHAFAQTHIYRYKNNNFIFKGPLLSLNKKDVQDIHNGNSVYCTNYEMINAYEAKKIGIILLGTKNPLIVKKFYSKNGIVIDPLVIKSKL